MASPKSSALAKKSELDMPDARLVIVLTTWPVDRDPADLARWLVDERLVACVNVLPEMRSFYRWEGRVHDEHERQVLMKTSTDRLAALERRLHELHPFDVPEFLVLDVRSASDAYGRWVVDNTTP
jgi:periplasmic divalent cation tolerance protein